MAASSILWIVNHLLIVNHDAYRFRSQADGRLCIEKMTVPGIGGDTLRTGRAPPTTHEAHFQGFGIRRAFRSRMALGIALVLGCVPAVSPRTAPAAPVVYFDGIRDQLLRQIDVTTTSIDLAIFDLTSPGLAAALASARDRGVAVRVVADARQARKKRSQVSALAAAGVEVRLAPAKGRGIMHHKFALLDRRLLVTGSYNWTEAAEHRNAENTLLLDDADLVARYAKIFESLFSAGRPPSNPATP